MQEPCRSLHWSTDLCTGQQIFALINRSLHRSVNRGNSFSHQPVAQCCNLTGTSVSLWTAATLSLSIGHASGMPGTSWGSLGMSSVWLTFLENRLAVPVRMNKDCELWCWRERVGGREVGNKLQKWRVCTHNLKLMLTMNVFGAAVKRCGEHTHTHTHTHTCTRTRTHSSCGRVQR